MAFATTIIVAEMPEAEGPDYDLSALPGLSVQADSVFLHNHPALEGWPRQD
jgi:hypothetical protein